jgi:HEAT repeat protein
VGATLKIKKSYDLKTIAPAGEAPRFHMEGASDIVFDTEKGVIKSGEFKGEIVIVDKNEMRRIPLSASYRLMTAEEVAAARLKALEAAKEAAALKPISDADITTAIAELKAGGAKVQFAADRLARSIPVDDRREDVVTELLTLLKERDDFVRAAAAKALKTWGTSKNVPTFIDLLKDNSIFARFAALEALGELKDAKGAEAVAQQLPDFRVRMQAAASLKAMGSVAEKAVATLLKDKEWSVRLEACKVLGAIGTGESVAALKAAQDDSNRLVASEAEKAIKEIGGR